MMIFLVWLHILATVIWIGGSLFLSLALVPALKGELFTAQRGALFRTVAGRFRKMVWASIITLVATGSILLTSRVVSLAEPAGWPFILKLKLALVALVIALTAVHDFWLGPKVAALTRRSPVDRSATEQRLIRLSPWVARLGLLLALGIAYLGVAVVRV